MVPLPLVLNIVAIPVLRMGEGDRVVPLPLVLNTVAIPVLRMGKGGGRVIPQIVPSVVAGII